GAPIETAAAACSCAGYGEYTVWSAMVIPQNGVWLDLRVATDRSSAEALFGGMTGHAPESQDDTFDALVEIVNVFQCALKAGIAKEGGDALTPFIPKAMATSAWSAPEKLSPCIHYRVHLPEAVIDLALIEQAGLLVRKPVPRLLPFDVVAE